MLKVFLNLSRDLCSNTVHFFLFHCCGHLQRLYYWTYGLYRHPVFSLEQLILLWTIYLLGFNNMKTDIAQKIKGVCAKCDLLYCMVCWTFKYETVENVMHFIFLYKWPVLLLVYASVPFSQSCDSCTMHKLKHIQVKSFS